jgi:ABC-type nitrate/sulfonate/bicarbonate transport system substrate-binding protein
MRFDFHQRACGGRRRVLSGLIGRNTFCAVIAIASIGVWGAQPLSAAEYKATLAQNLSPISGVSIIAKAKGYFEKNGLDITVSNFTSGKQCLNAVLGGAAQIATTAEAPTTAAAMSKQPIAFLARMEYSDLKTLAGSGAGIKSLGDLKGKKLAFTAGTGSEVYTMALLRKAGLSKDDVKLTSGRRTCCLRFLPAISTPTTHGNRISRTGGVRWEIRRCRSIPPGSTPKHSISSSCKIT